MKAMFVSLLIQAIILLIQAIISFFSSTVLLRNNLKVCSKRYRLLCQVVSLKIQTAMPSCITKDTDFYAKLYH